MKIITISMFFPLILIAGSKELANVQTLITTGELLSEVNANDRIQTALKHLKYEIEYKDEPRQAIIPFRKYYTGYLKGLHHSSKIRQELMKYIDYEPIEEILLKYLDDLNNITEN